jgi:hypothetical protein
MMDAVRYENTRNGSVVIIEEFHKGKRFLAFKTMWKKKAKPTE